MRRFDKIVTTAKDVLNNIPVVTEAYGDSPIITYRKFDGSDNISLGPEKIAVSNDILLNCKQLVRDIITFKKELSIELDKSPENSKYIESLDNIKNHTIKVYNDVLEYGG